MCDCSICIADKEIRLCKIIAKFLQNLPFQLAKFCVLDAKFEIFFCKKPRGQINGLKKTLTSFTFSRDTELVLPPGTMLISMIEFLILGKLSRKVSHCMMVD